MGAIVVAEPISAVSTPKKTLNRQASRTSLTPTNAKSSKTPMPTTTTKDIWRPPGKANIRDVLENAFLPASPIGNTLELRKEDAQNSSGRPPWYPPSWYPGIPTPAPVQRAEQEFEKKIKKAVPKIPMLSNDPKLKYVGFKEIGTGVNGSVVKASMRTNPNVVVAIKRCKVDSDREYRAAILRELRIMSTGNPNLIKIREVALWRDEVWMAMDLMRCSVFAVLCKRGIPEEYVVYIARETLKGLTYLHGKGFIHRDVKCENLLLGKNGEVKLADFGLAARSERLNRDRLGTSKWMAPEVIREQPYDNRVDMWSLGITIIEMMDRVPPHYLIKDEEELFTVILSEPSPTFTYSYPTMYMRGLVAWLLDEDRRTRPGAKDVLMELDAHVQQRLLECSNAADLAQFLGRVLDKA